MVTAIRKRLQYQPLVSCNFNLSLRMTRRTEIQYIAQADNAKNGGTTARRLSVFSSPTNRVLNSECKTIY